MQRSRNGHSCGTGRIDHQRGRRSAGWVHSGHFPPSALKSALGLGCVKTRRGASAGEETSVQITAGGQKFASESDFNRPKKNHSRCFSTFWVSTQPRSFAPFERVSVRRHVRYCSGSYQTGVRPHLQRSAIGDTSSLRMRQQRLLPSVDRATSVRLDWRMARVPLRGRADAPDQAEVDVPPPTVEDQFAHCLAGRGAR
jgi:hypothetical protein